MAFYGASILIMLSVGAGMAIGSGIPPIDERVPAKLETATFALG